MNPISRRQFVRLGAAGAVAGPAALHYGLAQPPVTITAQEIVDRIRQKIDAEWKPETVDTFKAGDPASLVKGIVTTTMATLPVLRLAVKAGANFIITGEPAFYSKGDAGAPPAGRRGGPPPAPDSVFAAKNEFIKSNGLVIWRFSDHWRLHKPDPLAMGLTDVLGWSKFRGADDVGRVTIPVITLDALVSDLKKKLNVRGGIRVVGDPKLRVQKIGLLPGTTPIQAALQLLPTVDAVIAGEVREWESVEYVHDKVAAGGKKSLVLLGRVVSEDPGMNVCAQWVKSIVPEVATTWIPVGDPYWKAGLMPSLSAAEVVARIKTHLGIPWRDTTYRDTFKCGGPDTEVKGIATAMFCSFELVRRAAEAGLNMIIPHEDTWWNDRDEVTIVSGDPLYRTKVDFMTQHNIVIFRIHDHMHAQRPDFTYVGAARSLGLESKYETSPQSHRFTIPETTLGALAADFQKRLGTKALRVVGDPNAKVSRIQLGVGYATPAVNLPDVDVVVSGELQETDGAFDSPEYVLDAMSLGIPKGWIMLGHAVSEEQGMLEMAQWVKSFTPEVPVQLIRTGEPFWAPR